MGHWELSRTSALTLRYDYLDDQDAWRTGIEQKLNAATVVYTFHLSALAGKAPLAVTYPRTQVRIHDVDLKMEYRYNWSNKTVFAGHRSAVRRRGREEEQPPDPDPGGDQLLGAGMIARTLVMVLTLAAERRLGAPHPAGGGGSRARCSGVAARGREEAVAA